MTLVDAYKNWDPKTQAEFYEQLQIAQASDWKPFYCPLPLCDGKPHGKDWSFPHARADQRPPKWTDNWLTWLLRSGRGSGKTRTGAEVVNRITKNVARMALIGPTGPDIRETMVEGPSGILACAKPSERPTWNPSRKLLTWPNGCIAQGFSGEEPDRIRGGNFGAAWCDEPAHIDLIVEVWANLLLTLRENGPYPNHIIATTTPRPSKWMKALTANPNTITVSVSTYANLDNLSSTFRETVLESFEGTRWGRQELYGEILEDVEGSLWKAEMIRFIDFKDLPDLDRIVVAVDPAGSCNVRSDETGIIVIGIKGKNLYVLADRSGKYSPDGWAQAAHHAYEEFSADCIVAEKNYGGDMVKNTLENVGFADVLIRLVNSRRGKQLRAEPVVALYEKDLVRHVQGGDRADLVDLENEQVEWVPGRGASPNRIDALVHGAWELVRGFGGPVSIADPNQILKDYTAPTNRFGR